MRIRRRVWEILDVPAPGDWPSIAFDVAIQVLIVLNLVMVVLETVPEIRLLAPRAFLTFDRISIAVFSVEYVLRMWACVESPAFASPLGGRVRFALTPLSVIDLLAVLPFYLPFLGVDLRFVWMLRLFRLFRVAKLARYSQAVHILGRVLLATKEELFTALFVVLMLIFFSSSLMYYAERDAQPDKFHSIPAAMWWSVNTLTTVGYGDVVPVTGAGKVLAGIIAILGIGMFALPAGILGAGFIQELRSRNTGPPRTCPHCGKEIPE